MRNDWFLVIVLTSKQKYMKSKNHALSVGPIWVFLDGWDGLSMISPNALLCLGFEHSKCEAQERD
jgi:hypothetical protein